MKVDVSVDYLNAIRMQSGKFVDETNLSHIFSRSMNQYNVEYIGMSCTTETHVGARYVRMTNS